MFWLRVILCGILLVIVSGIILYSLRRLIEELVHAEIRESINVIIKKGKSFELSTRSVIGQLVKVSKITIILLYMAIIVYAFLAAAML